VDLSASVWHADHPRRRHLIRRGNGELINDTLQVVGGRGLLILGLGGTGDMTEAQWLTSTDSAAMLRSLVGRYSAQARRGETPDFEKLRLFACACLRRIWNLLDEDHRRSVEMIESHVRAPTRDGLRAARKSRRGAGNQASIEYDRVSRAVPRDRRACLIAWGRNVAASAVWQAADQNPVRAANCHRQAAQAVHSIQLAEGATADGPDPGSVGYQLPKDGELVAQAALLREVVGNPFIGKMSVKAQGQTPNDSPHRTRPAE
jgi:hypothetical protein